MAIVNAANEGIWLEGPGSLALDRYYPEWLHDRPLRIGVRLQLTEYATVNSDFFERWTVDSIAGALGNLIRNPDLFLVYDIFVEGAVPAWKHWVDAPLRRRTAMPPQDMTLLSREVDDQAAGMLFQLRNRPLSYRTSRLMLKTGGATADAASHGWDVVAKAVRADLRGLLSGNIKS